MCHMKCMEYLLMILLVKTTVLTCHHINDTYRLVHDKFLNYDKTIRPKINQSEPTLVYLTFGLVTIKELDEVSQRLSVTAVMSLAWTDELLHWNPNDYGNMTLLRADSGRFWTPNLVLVNNAEMTKGLATVKPTILNSDGTVIIIPSETFSVSCEMDVTAYPWDRHVCFLVLSSEVYDPSELLIIPLTQEVDKTHYISHGTWELCDSRIMNFKTPHFSNLFIYLSFERRPRFAILNVILPIIFMSFLNILVFLIPTESGERISYTLTMLLAIAVFLSTIGDNLPRTSTFMPIFNYYIISMLAMSVFITLTTTFSLRLFHADGTKPMPRCIAMVVTWLSRRIRPRNNITPESSDKKLIGTNHAKISDDVNNQNNKQQSSTLQQELNHLDLEQGNNLNMTEKSNDTNIEIKDFGKKVHVTWKDVSSVYDMFFFLVFLVLYILATVTYFVMVFRSYRLTIDNVIENLKRFYSAIDN